VLAIATLPSHFHQLHIMRGAQLVRAHRVDRARHLGTTRFTPEQPAVVWLFSLPFRSSCALPDTPSHIWYGRLWFLAVIPTCVVAFTLATNSVFDNHFLLDFIAD
jgi:hypothetical protein